ncbi:hypothetical protein LINPERPRIM_LOCUS27551 [Linum perenne]
MSGGAPASSSHPTPPPPSSGPSSSGPIPPPMRRILAFVSMKPSFVAPDDYHRFSTSHPVGVEVGLGRTVARDSGEHMPHAPLLPGGAWLVGAAILRADVGRQH